MNDPRPPMERAQAALDPYEPRSEKPWNAARAAHFFRRCAFGADRPQIEEALLSTPAALLAAQLAEATAPAPPGDWTTTRPFATVGNAERAQYYTWIRDSQEWWMRLMLEPGRGLREKMVLFWHNHFVSEYPTVIVAQFLHRQNQLFRELAFGSFKELTRRITIDAGMLIYLDGATSRAGNPNENYARELLELFTLGAGAYSDGTPHYTEHDIVELARALTGWTINYGSSGEPVEFKPARFDAGMKTIFGLTRNWSVDNRTPDDVIDLIFDLQDPDVGQPRAAVFLCQKLYVAFVHDHPDPAIVAAMASTLVANDWNVGAVLQQLLASELFMDDQVIGARIKSPVEYVLNAVRHFELNAPMDRTKSDATQPQIHDPVTVASYLSQTLFWPPNVKGWPGGRTWISGATVPLRIRYAKMWIEPTGNALPYGFDPLAWIRRFPDYTRADRLVDHMIEHLLPFPVSAATRESILLELVSDVNRLYEWQPDDPTSNAAVRVRSALLRITGLAEYQLL